MKTNEELQRDVQDALKWEPLLHAAEIGVIVKDGVVTLTGTLDSYYKKTEAEDAVKNVAGVTAVVEKIDIQFNDSWTKSDEDIANEILDAFKLKWEIPSDKVKVRVEKGWVTLEGAFEWNYQKEAAKESVRNLDGVKGVSNNITIKTDTQEEIEKKDIEQAFERNWSIKNQDINIKVSGNKVTLNGKVPSSYQKEEAERIAWKTPGIWHVDNEIKVEYLELMD